MQWNLLQNKEHYFDNLDYDDHESISRFNQHPLLDCMVSIPLLLRQQISKMKQTLLMVYFLFISQLQSDNDVYLMIVDD